MRRKLFSLLCCALLVCAFCPAASAAGTAEDIEYLSDGSYIVTELEAESSGPAVSAVSAVKAKTQTKNKTCYSADGTAQWRVRVTGTFTYGNGSAKCTASSVSTTVYSDDWKITGKSASKSGNKATATASALRSSSGSKRSSITLTVTLTCSATGTLS